MMIGSQDSDDCYKIKTSIPLIDSCVPICAVLNHKMLNRTQFGMQILNWLLSCVFLSLNGQSVIMS